MKDNINQIAKEPGIFHQLFVLKDEETMSTIIYFILVNNTKFVITEDWENSANGLTMLIDIMANPKQHEKIVDLISELFVKYNNCSELFRILSENEKKTEKFIVEVFKKLVKKEDIYNYIPDDDIFANETFVNDNLDDEGYNNLITEYSQNTDLISKTINNTFEPLKSSLYLSIFKIKRTDKNNFIQFVISNLQSLKKENWDSESIHLGEYVTIFDLLIALENENYNPNLGFEYFEFLKGFYHKVQNGDTVNEHIKVNWENLFKSLDESSKNTFLRTVRDELINSEITFENSINLFGDLLLNCAILNENADEIMRRGFNSILDRKNLIEYGWMNKVLKQCHEFKKKCHKDSKKYFKEKIESMFDETELSDEIKNLLLNTTDLMNIKIKKEKPDSDKNEEVE